MKLTDDESLTGQPPNTTAEMQQAGEAIPLFGPEALVAQVQRIGKVFQWHGFPGHHLCVRADPLPVFPLGTLLCQHARQPVAVGLGVDFIAHLNQQGQVLSGTEPSIQTKDGLDGGRIRGGRIRFTSMSRKVKSVM